MARLDMELAGGKNILAFLDMIAWSEIGKPLLDMPETDAGYKVCVGSTAEHPILFDDYSTHPLRRCAELNSDAAGRYQIMGRYFGSYKYLLQLPDFGPESQDKIAVRLIKECHAYNLVQNGQLIQALNACKSRWASLPGANYGQHEQKIADLQMAYSSAGGALNG